MNDQSILFGTPVLASSKAGQGPQPVVLVHGWTCRRHDWQALLDAPPPGTRLLAIDLPGHGDSRDVTPSGWTVTGLAEALVAALAGLDAAPILVGHSMGGAVVMEAARQMAVRGIVLVDTFVIPYGDLDEASARSIEQPFHDDFAAAIDNLVLHNAGPSMSASDRQALASRMASAPPAAMLPLWADLLRWSPEAAFAELDCPIHAINGDLIGDAARARCAGRVTEWHMPGTWHFPQLEQPAAFRAMFERVLGAVTV